MKRPRPKLTMSWPPPRSSATAPMAGVGEPKENGYAERLMRSKRSHPESGCSVYKLGPRNQVNYREDCEDVSALLNRSRFDPWMPTARHGHSIL